jgi:hypothetical protein
MLPKTSAHFHQLHYIISQKIVPFMIWYEIWDTVQYVYEAPGIQSVEEQIKAQYNRTPALWSV